MSQSAKERQMSLPSRVSRLPLWGIVFVLTTLYLFRHGPFQWLGDAGRDHIPDATRCEHCTWEQISPSKNLVYSSCFESFQCARLEVPLDWQSEDDKYGLTVKLAVIRLPARVPVTDPRYGGAVIVQPGGPGGSGVNMVLTAGRTIQHTVDSDITDLNANEIKYFDIIGFDPRGINNTRPKYQCFDDDLYHQLWPFYLTHAPVLGSSNVAFDNVWAAAMALAKSCTSTESKTESAQYLGEHMNTTPMIADIVELIERHGEWRENEAKRLMQAQCHDKFQQESSHSELTPASDRLQSISWKPGKEKLSYLGRSYGTAVGAMFATMHPERVERMVLDGVVDVGTFFQGEDLISLADTDRIMDKFGEYCFAGGAENCPLYRGTSSRDILSSLTYLLESLKGSPIPVPATSTRGPDIITYSDGMRLIRDALYRPHAGFHKMATLFNDLERGNGTAFADMKRRTFPACQGSHEYDSVCYDLLFEEVADAIECTDVDDLTAQGKEDFREYAQKSRNLSAWLGDVYSLNRLLCYGWETRPAWRFQGPFQSKPAQPLLLIGNTYDPVTPLRNAHSVASKFEGSVVLQQNSVGHCSADSHSNCTEQAIRAYFQKGVLPSAHTVCEPDSRPFSGTI